jgi:hypothetical protein
MNIRIGNLTSGRNRVSGNDLLRRQNDAHKILSPSDIAQGKVSGGRLLYTTLGGVPRQLTADDMSVFKAKAKELGTRYKGGATIDDIVRASRPEDMQRAREIKWSTPARLRNGTIDFIASASPQSQVTRHYVTVVLTDYGAALARAATPLQAAAWLAKEGHIRWDCTCGRHTFWYRYIATSIGANALRPETGYPRIRNAQLTGLGCKHTLRTVIELRDSMLVRKQVAKMVEADRARLDNPGRTKPQTVRVTQQEADRITAGRVRRIAVKPEQRRASLPKAPSRADITQALQAFKGRKDVTSVAVTRALNALLKQTQPGARP